MYIYTIVNRLTYSSDALFEIAEEQQGYFTTTQAAKAGYRLGSQAHHTKSGNWSRVERGIYRLKRFPQSGEEQLVIYSLWSRNRAGQPEGVYSHQTALSIHELSDLNPARLHMTVPPTFRRSAKVPKVLVLHHADLHPVDIVPRHGFAVTRPLRSIADLVAAESVSRDIIEQALAEGRQRGLISLHEITKIQRHETFPIWFTKLLASHQR